MGEGGPGQDLQGLVVVHLMAAEDAAVAVVGVLTHTHVGDDIEVGVLGLDGPNGLLDHAMLVPGRGAHGVLVGGQAEEDTPAHPRLDTFLHRLAHGVQPVVELPLQGVDGSLARQGLIHEDGVDKAVRGEAGLPAQPPDGVVLPQSAGPVNEFHLSDLL